MQHGSGIHLKIILCCWINFCFPKHPFVNKIELSKSTQNWSCIKSFYWENEKEDPLFVWCFISMKNVLYAILKIWFLHFTKVTHEGQIRALYKRQRYALTTLPLMFRQRSARESITDSVGWIRWLLDTQKLHARLR